MMCRSSVNPTTRPQAGRFNVSCVARKLEVVRRWPISSPYPFVVSGPPLINTPYCQRFPRSGLDDRYVSQAGWWWVSCFVDGANQLRIKTGVGYLNLGLV